MAQVSPDEGGFTIPLSDDGHAIIVPTEPIARLLSAGLRLYEAEDFSRNKLLLAPVPPSEEVSALLNDTIESFATDRLESAVEQELDRIDLLVGETLGLTCEQIRFIGREMADDPFLSRIRPRYPYFTPRLRGRRMRLESATRYLGLTA